MISLLILILYLIIFIFSIILLVYCIKRNTKKLWTSLFILETISIVGSFILLVYYNNLPGYGFMPGLYYLGEVLSSFGALILYSIMLFITICSKIIIYENTLKKQGKKYKSPFYLILSVIIIVIGIFGLGTEILENLNIHKSIGTVIGFEEKKIRYDNSERIKAYPVISFTVGDIEYTDNIYPNYFEDKNIEIGDIVDIYYNSSSNDYYITRPTNNKYFYIPCLALGLLIIFLRFKDKFTK